MNNGENVFFSVVAGKKYPIVDHAEGAYIYDVQGKRYLDFAAGIAVANIGHSVPEVIEAMHEQAKKICFVYGGTFTSEARNELAAQIIDMAPEGMDKVFLCSGGSEAMESVIKIARQYHLECGHPEKHKVISRWQSYHGNTLATLAMGGRPSWSCKYDPYMIDMPHIAQCNCYRCPYGQSYPSCGVACARELERVIKYEGAGTVSAFVLEPVIGTTDAAVAPPKEYFPMVREICDKYDVLLCVDEVITGFGRTGKNFAMDHFGVAPDLIGFAKGLGAGYAPIGGVIAHKKIVDAVANGSGALTHSFTFSGNPLVCATASAVLKYIKQNDLVARCAKMGEYFLKKLKTLEDLPAVGDVRGIGLMMGIEFVRDKQTKEPYPNSANISGRIASWCFERGLMVTAGVQGSADGVVGEAMQIAPPYIITEEQADFAVGLLREGILEITAQIEKELA